MLKLTPTEQRVYDLLGDGKPRKKTEVLAVLDEQADDACLFSQVYRLNLKIRDIGEEVIAQAYGTRVVYRRIRCLEVPKQSEASGGT